MMVNVGAAYGEIVIDVSGVERAVAAAQRALQGLDGINFGAGIGAGLASIEGGLVSMQGGLSSTLGCLASTQVGLVSTQGSLASMQVGLSSTQGGLSSTQGGLSSTIGGVVGLQQRVVELGAVGSAALSGLRTLLANLSANAADGLGLSRLGTQIDTLQAKVQSGFLTIKEQVTLAVTNFQWADYIRPLAWPPVPTLGWADYVRPFGWPTLPAFGWANYVAPLTWPTVPSFDWNRYVSPLTWPTVPSFRWNEYLKPLGWPTLPSFRWDDFISRFSWPTLPAIPGFASGGVASGGLARVAEQGAEVLRWPGGQGLAMVAQELVLPLPAGTEIYQHAQSMAMVRELFGASLVPTPREGGVARVADVMPLPAAAPAPITINATINNQVNAEHWFRRIQRLQARRGRGDY